MKLSTKIILPIILISALLILLAGCFGVPDEDPGYTPGTITGTIASPCCSTSDGPVTESSGAPEFWCYYCQETWSLQDGVEVILTYGEDEIATTTTNENGEFTFTDVPPGKNYVITALCPDYEDDRPLVKDVALELVEGGSFDTKTTDIVSTSLGLVVDFLVEYTEWGPEDISLDEVIANGPNFYAFPKFKQLILEVRRVLENCENVDTDEDVQEALCLAAEEISKLDIGCAPGYTPPDPTPNPCAGNDPPTIDSVLLDGTPVPYGGTVNLVEGTQHVVTVNASDDGIADPLTYSATINGLLFGAVTSNVVTGTIPGGTFEVLLIVSDGCTTDTWPVTVNTVAYNVYYDANTGTGTQTDTNDYFAGDSATVKNQGSMLKDNHTFNRWDTQADGLGDSYAPTDSLTMPAADVTLYAQWDEDEKYTVTYDGNGNTSGTAPVDTLSPYYAGVTVTVLGQGDLARDKYNFTGWNTAADGLGTPYVENDTFLMPAADVTLYAQWEKLDPETSPIDVVPGQNQIRINLRDVNDNPILGLDNISDWEVTLYVPDSDATIVFVEYGGSAIGPWDFQIRVVNIPQGTLLRNVTVIYKGYGYDLILHEAYP
jgi:uncharacterized repeat protein (TIGR02543 family)